ncbi:hypothetical protein scyTo_0019103, partial [Scyliorhinus torazame]|nr:hypothetical protein [Scyliorhinus torazame]
LLPRRKMATGWISKLGNKSSSSDEDNLLPKKGADEFKSSKKLGKLLKHSPDNGGAESQKLKKHREIEDVSLKLAETNQNQKKMLDIGYLLEEMEIKMRTFNMSLHNHEEFFFTVYNTAKREDERDFIQWEQNLERGNPVTGRPRTRKQQFTEIVRQFVQRQIPLFMENDAENNVMEHVSKVQQVVQKEKVFQAKLDIKALSLFLFWVTHTYKSEEFMGHINIRDITLKASVLDPILEVNWIYKASEKFINAVQSQINVRLTRRLKMENVPWSQLPIDIKQIMLCSIEDGQLVSETIRGRIQNFCAVQLIGILER